MKSLTVIVLFLLGMSISLQAQAQGQAITLGHSFTLQSDILNEERPYMVYLPKDYDQQGEPVAVMYLMDGSGHFLHTSGMVEFLINQGRIPDMMIVAIPNTTDRTRDLTPPIEIDEASKQRMPTAGGANKTLAFIKEELMPQIEERYNTNSYRLLVGHSFGGIFVVNSLLTEPELFDAYISISPSLWWDQGNLIDKAEVFLDKHPDLDAYFYMTVGKERASMVGGAMKLAATFQLKAPQNFHWDFQYMEEENHGSIPHRSTYDGLEAIFKDWYRVDIPELYKTGGLEAVEEYLAVVEKKMGYEKKLSENMLNRLGYNLMRTGYMKDALKIFQKNVQQYPTSYNVYDSMGEAYMKAGKQEEAISHYKKSLDLHPGNRNAVNMLSQMGVSVDPSERQIKLANRQMKQFVGTYSGMRGMTLYITMENGQLMATADPMIARQELLPYPDNKFILKDMNMMIEFRVNDQEKVTGYTAQMGIGQQVSGLKLE